MKKILLLLGMLFPFNLLANPACVVCTVAIGASLSIARKLGVDDCIVGLWAGAMLLMIGYWTIRFCDKKGWQFPFYKPILIALSLSMIGFIYVSQLQYNPIIIGIFYMDSFLFSALCGALVFDLALRFYFWMKAKNGGHAHFPFEKVVVPILSLIILSGIFHHYPICNCAFNNTSSTLEPDFE